jgi:2-keto-4-pentenoate hydratase/2-oxohepta-3-ene-1,7-dioic acid hydratase in catechol pathway
MIRIAILCAVALVTLSIGGAATADRGRSAGQKFARFIGAGGQPVYGIVDGENLREITDAPWADWKKTDRLTPASKVKFLPVTEARNVYAMAGNYKDHLVGATPERLEKAKIPQFFLKSTSCLAGHGDDIRLPEGSDPVHYEGELVVVIGKGGRDIPKEKALDHVLGVTAGNDVSARDWQTKDIQWWRAKGSDTFGPCGPFIATGLDYGDLDMELRQNGEVRMKTNTNMLIHDIATSIAFLSKHVTLHPGDLIFTGTASQTQAIKAGDVIEVELEGVGVLRNKVVADD